MQSLTWYVDRLRRMSPAEMCYRFVQTTRAHAARVAKARRVPEPRLSASSQFIHCDAGCAVDDYVANAERVIDGRYSFFDLEDRDLGHPPLWNRDPLTGRLAPLDHASVLDYRDERRVGNIKYLWEPSRHLHVPTLAQAFALTRNARYADALRVHIDSWIEQCPPERGVHWASSLELAIRLINWSIAWQLLGGHEASVFEGAAGREFRARWLESIYRQTRAITRKLSRFSSANNHLIGEAAGVWVASLTWDAWPQMRSWRERCKAILEAEVLQQNGTDGGNREQAFAYQQFVLDFALIAGLAARAAGHDFSRDYWQRIEAMVDFVASMMDVNGNLPMIGDADDGYVVRLAPGSRDTRSETRSGQRGSRQGAENFRSLLATGAVLFDRADFAAKARQFDDKSAWLLGCEGRQAFAALLARGDRYRTRQAFTDAGYYIVGAKLDSDDEIRMLIDAGSLGYLSIAAHGHADALSFVLSVAGEDVFIDPGTYAYHTAPEWRRYFRSTRAHNTILIDGKDQSDQSGNFMWSRHANARCLEFADRNGVQRFAGEHDGYRALRDPVLHRREIEFDERTSTFTIVDTLDCQSQHTARLHWHCGEHVTPVVTDDGFTLDTHRHQVRVRADRVPDRVFAFRGGKSEEGGWVSRSFGRKEPTTTLAWEYEIHGRTTVRTYICVETLAQDTVSRDS